MQPDQIPDAERSRMERIDREYSTSARTQRAWRRDANLLMRRDLLARIFGRIEPQLGGAGQILDIGCGTGAYLRDLSMAGVDPARLHGVDVLESRLRTAAERVPGAQLQLGDARRLPFPDGSFTIVLVSTLLSSLSSRHAMVEALTEARRVLAPGGILICYDMRFPSPVNRHVRRVPKRLLLEVLGTGAQIEAVTVLPPLSRWLAGHGPQLYGRLARVRPLLSHWLASYVRPPSAGSEWDGSAPTDAQPAK
jgi:ubiquinone/menaquinone biosynthesis C-methylase UbiE